MSDIPRMGTYDEAKILTQNNFLKSYNGEVDNSSIKNQNITDMQLIGNIKTPIKRVRDINWSDRKYIRAGIIPIVIQGNIKFFGFGIENKVAAIGDFGGHKENIDNDVLDAALREYREEALNVFGDITRDMVQDFCVLEGIDTVEILVPVPGPIFRYTEIFRSMIGNYANHEVQNIIWLSKKQLLIAIDSQESAFNGIKMYHMYNKIWETIRLNRDII